LCRLRSAAAPEPEDFSFAYFLMRTLSLAGRHDEVLAEYRERWARTKR
jgi:hypothetical protein